MIMKDEIKATVWKTPHAKCARCYKHHVSVGLIALYQDLCCVCAYDIHHLLVPNAAAFKRDGDLKALTG